MKQVLKYFGVFLLWYLVSSALLGVAFMTDPALIPPAAVPVLVVLLYVALLRGYLLREDTGDRSRRRAALRLHPLRGGTLRWSLVAVPVFLLLVWALQEVYLRLVPVPVENLNPFGEFLDSPAERLSIGIMAVGIAPVLEEFFFRGLIQRSLERRWGPFWGITGAAALFGAVHVLPWIFPLHFLLGMAFGFAVYAARSIWAGVLLHAANNAVAFVGLVLQDEEPTLTPTLWEIGADVDWWVALLVLLASLALAGWTARRLWAAGRGARLRYA